MEELRGDYGAAAVPPPTTDAARPKVSDAVLIDQNQNARIIHAVNSQLITTLFGDGLESKGFLEGLLINRADWIINVLYTHGAPNESAVLKTSSTLHRGVLYDHRPVRGRDVRSIDETVPLASSVCGRSVLSGRPIWLGQRDLTLDLQSANDFGGKYYRRFSLVDVRTPGGKIPFAEIVFPIADQHLNVTMALGVLNLELFGDTVGDSDTFIQHVPRESINELLCDLLHVHAGFLKVAIDVLDLLPPANDPAIDVVEIPMDAHIERILALHSFAMKQFEERSRANIKYLEDALANVQLSLPTWG